jgi:HSP20 family molecular chaperone IbpA
MPRMIKEENKMLVPRLYNHNRDFFDDFFDFGWPELPNVSKELYGKRAGEVMKTDVKETEDGYKVAIDLPGFKKDEIEIELKDGYMTVSAAKGIEKDQKDDEGRYIRRERYSGNVRRSFYVGESLTEDDIHASFEDGILRLELPKEEKKPEVETRRLVSIN